MVEEKTIKEIERLGALDEDELNNLMNEDKERALRLLMAIGAFTTNYCGMTNKLYEKAAELRLSVHEKREAIHTKHSYGADIRIKDEKTGLFIDEEIKSSVVKKTLLYKTNWIFSATGKFNGTVRLEAIWGTDVFKSYILSGRFVTLYIARVVSRHEKTKVVNLGCAYCERHQTYHRADKFIKYDTLLSSREGDLTEDEWKSVFKHAVKCKEEKK